MYDPKSMKAEAFISHEEILETLAFADAHRADTAMIPMQDVLGLGGWARMNRPGTIGNNWLWRMAPGAATPELAQRLRRENEATNRRMD